ncbi:Hsp20/alpha crystallin family protein [Gloeothece verrucosa]|uniref:Heat shock protein Hsp20 n=1 Tax=Gloeothece verrucosa (strain PCC 7822) TaxID=497965 RepID=E0UH50_GLOV7|nr:Hsp20/alpha crystallin family protein [Gloeothece verrucosa]ADN15649.1 heat shock protein Hsp20 [Gloeothece verrucosa PCC 7822]
MPIIRYSPFQELETLQRQMNRLFDDFFVPARTENSQFNFVPAAELSETDEALYLKLEIPGINPQEVDIQVTKDVVSISGERQEANKTENNGVTRSEFRYGRFERVIPLPKKVQNTNVTADYKDGILTLTLPKAEEEQNRVIKVNVN